MRTRITVSLGIMLAATVAMMATTSIAQTNVANLDKLKAMKVSGTDPNLPLVPQSGPNADAIRANLKYVTLPEGSDQLVMCPFASRAIDRNCSVLSGLSEALGGDTLTCATGAGVG